MTKWFLVLLKIEGCTDESAFNYEGAALDDGSYDYVVGYDAVLQLIIIHSTKYE